MSLTEKASVWLNDVGKTKYKSLYDSALESQKQSGTSGETDVIFKMLIQNPFIIQEINNYSSNKSNEINPIPQSPPPLPKRDTNVELIPVSTNNNDQEDEDEEKEDQEEIKVEPVVESPINKNPDITINEEGGIDITSEIIPEPPTRPSTPVRIQSPKKMVRFSKPLITENENQSSKTTVVKETVCKESVIIDQKTNNVKLTPPECSVTEKVVENPIYSKSIKESVKINNGVIVQTKITTNIQPKDPNQQTTNSEIITPTSPSPSIEEPISKEQSVIVETPILIEEPTVEEQVIEKQEVKEPLVLAVEKSDLPPPLPERDVVIPLVEPTVSPLPEPSQKEIADELEDKREPITIVVEPETKEIVQVKTNDVEEPINKKPISIVLVDSLSPEYSKTKDQELIEEQKQFKEARKKELSIQEEQKIQWVFNNEEGTSKCLVNYLYIILQSQLKFMFNYRPWRSEITNLLAKDPKETFGCTSFNQETFGKSEPIDFSEILTNFFQKYPVSREQALEITFKERDVGRRIRKLTQPWLLTVGKNSDGSLEQKSPYFENLNIDEIRIPAFCFFVSDRSKIGKLDIFPPQNLNNSFISEYEYPITLAAILVNKNESYSLLLYSKGKYLKYEYPSQEPIAYYTYSDLEDLDLGPFVSLALYRVL